jgi:hypothetical protein
VVGTVMSVAVISWAIWVLRRPDRWPRGKLER